MAKVMGSGPKRNIKDIPLVIPKGLGGQGGRTEYEQLKECPDSFKIGFRSSDLIKKFKGGETVTLTVINDKEVKLMIGIFSLGNLSKEQAQKISRCVRLGMKYQGIFRIQETKRGLQQYAEFRRVT